MRCPHPPSCFTSSGACSYAGHAFVFINMTYTHTNIQVFFCINKLSLNPVLQLRIFFYVKEITLIPNHLFYFKENESVSVIMKSCQEVRSSVGVEGNDDNLVGEQLLSSATDQILTISTMEGSMYPPGR